MPSIVASSRYSLGRSGNWVMALSLLIFRNDCNCISDVLPVEISCSICPGQTVEIERNLTVREALSQSIEI